MNYAAIKKTDVANGPGVRVSLFVSGCTHHCKGCFNEEAWDFSYGKPFDQHAVKEIVEALEPDYIRGFSLLGGEPFEPEIKRFLLASCAMCVSTILKRPFGATAAISLMKIC